MLKNKVFCGGSWDYDLDNKRRIINRKCTAAPTIIIDKWTFEDLGDASELDKYCIDRLISANELYRSEFWDVVIKQGYYGEEIAGLRLDELTADNVDEQINKLLSLENNSLKIEYVLKAEYGRLINSVKNVNWVIKDVDFSQINFGSDDHFRKVSKKALSHYEKYNLPRAICLKRDFSGDVVYRVIDGYHRLIAAKTPTVRIITNE